MGNFRDVFFALPIQRVSVFRSPDSGTDRQLFETMAILNKPDRMFTIIEARNSPDPIRTTTLNQKLLILPATGVPKDFSKGSGFACIFLNANVIFHRAD